MEFLSVFTLPILAKILLNQFTQFSALDIWPKPSSPTTPQVISDYPALPSATVPLGQFNKELLYFLSNFSSTNPSTLLFAFKSLFSFLYLELSPVLYWGLFCPIEIVLLFFFFFYHFNYHPAPVSFDTTPPQVRIFRREGRVWKGTHSASFMVHITSKSQDIKITSHFFFFLSRSCAQLQIYRAQWGLVYLQIHKPTLWQ